MKCGPGTEQGKIGTTDQGKVGTTEQGKVGSALPAGQRTWTPDEVPFVRESGS